MSDFNCFAAFMSFPLPMYIHSHSNIYAPILLHLDIKKMRKYYGLTGVKLNIAIAVVAGTDFALFGYGKKVSSPQLVLHLTL
jgi:hypothetical protein